jgi:hypothetical protein
VRRTDHLHMPNVLNSGNLSLLGPSGTVQGCTWITVYKVSYSKGEVVFVVMLAACTRSFREGRFIGSYRINLITDWR